MGKAPESMQSAVFSIVFPKFEYKCHPNHLYAPTAYAFILPLEWLKDRTRISLVEIKLFPAWIIVDRSLKPMYCIKLK
jgi:hypothetical protein